MLRLVSEQEDSVELIKQRGEEVVQAVESRNVQLDKGIVKEKSRRN
jgi:hypothetical protein